MARGKTSSDLSLSERREEAFVCFNKGWTNADVARHLSVSPDTAGRYRALWEETLQREAQTNPSLLRDVLENTIKALSELDLVRKAAWEMHDEVGVHAKECPECETVVTFITSGRADQRAQALRILVSAQEQRGKLFNLFGVKAEYMQHVQQVQRMQNLLIDFMQRELCPEDRRKLELLLAAELGEVPESLPAIPAESEEIQVA